MSAIELSSIDRESEWIEFSDKSSGRNCARGLGTHCRVEQWKAAKKQRSTVSAVSPPNTGDTVADRMLWL